MINEVSLSSTTDDKSTWKYSIEEQLTTISGGNEFENDPLAKPKRGFSLSDMFTLSNHVLILLYIHTAFSWNCCFMVDDWQSVVGCSKSKTLRWFYYHWRQEQSLLYSIEEHLTTQSWGEMSLTHQNAPLTKPILGVFLFWHLYISNHVLIHLRRKLWVWLPKRSPSKLGDCSSFDVSIRELIGCYTRCYHFQPVGVAALMVMVDWLVLCGSSKS